MKFIKEVTLKGVYITAGTLKISKLPGDEKLELHTLDNALVLLKGRMTAPELLAAAHALADLAAGLIGHLAGVCGPCSDCGGNCPGDDLGEKNIDLPEYLRKEAGIPENVKLCAEIDREKKAVTILASGHRYDLRDLSDDLLSTFIDAGTCLSELEKHMILEDIIYGG